MAEIKDVIAYFCKHYPRPDDLSNARLTKMVYLADWKSAIERDRQMTGIEWQFNHYGPYVPDAIETARRDPAFEILATRNAAGNTKRIVRLAVDQKPDLEEGERQILDHVIRTTEDLSWSDFIHLVYSTYPLMAESRYSPLDLVALAKRYQDEQDALRRKAS